jgi:hypothetical protein
MGDEAEQIKFLWGLFRGRARRARSPRTWDASRRARRDAVGPRPTVRVEGGMSRSFSGQSRCAASAAALLPCMRDFSGF